MSTTAMSQAPPRYIRVLEHLGFWGALTVGGPLLLWWLQAARALHLSPMGYAMLLLLLPLAALLADFVSGLVHFLFDNYGSERTPVFGPAFIRPFRTHHVSPGGITEHGLIPTCGTTALGALPLLMGLLWGLPAPGEASLLQVLVVALFGGFVGLSILTNQIHKWAHMAAPPAVVRWLQRRGLILSAPRHGLHHSAAHDSHYCITTGWCNPLLERIRFWQRLQALLGPGDTHPEPPLGRMR